MPRRKTKEDFIKDAMSIYGDRYDYSKVNYVNSKVKVIIICKTHGEFEQIPNSHLLGKCGCIECHKQELRAINSLGKDEFVKRANLAHYNKYDYSQVKYITSHTKVTIICPIHGKFEQTPDHHINIKTGCPKCGRFKTGCQNRKSKGDFLEMAIEKFGNKFDYSNIDYIDYDTPITIKCSIHGLFKMKPSIHIRTKTGCQECAKLKIARSIASMDTETYIRKCVEIHGDRYDYSSTDYFSYKKKVKIRCKIHGIFSMLPQTHISGSECPICIQQKIIETEQRKNAVFEERKKHRALIEEKRIKSKKLLQERKERTNSPYKDSEFVKMATIIHGNDYSYDKVHFTNMNTPVTIYCRKHNCNFEQKPIKHLKGQGCPKCIGRNKTTEEFTEEAKAIHGDRYIYDLAEYKKCDTKVKIKCSKHGVFKQTPSKHLSGRGCPKCDSSYLELSVLTYLKTNSDINIETQKQFKWLKTKRTMPLDFFLPDYNIAIECQGEQHFMNTTLYGTNGAFEKQKSKDLLKYNLCKEHGIRILYFTDKRYKLPSCYIDKVYTSHEDLLKEIQISNVPNNFQK